MFCGHRHTCGCALRWAELMHGPSVEYFLSEQVVKNRSSMYWKEVSHWGAVWDSRTLLRASSTES